MGCQDQHRLTAYIASGSFDEFSLAGCVLFWGGGRTVARPHQICRRPGWVDWVQGMGITPTEQYKGQSSPTGSPASFDPRSGKKYTNTVHIKSPIVKGLLYLYGALLYLYLQQNYWNMWPLKARLNFLNQCHLFSISRGIKWLFHRDNCLWVTRTYFTELMFLWSLFAYCVHD